MPKLLQARAPRDDAEEGTVRKVAASRHAPGDWIRRAKIICLSWDGWRTTSIATELNCHPQTVRERLERFNAEGVDGLGDRSGAGRKARLSEHDRSQIVALVGSSPPGHLSRQSDGSLEADDVEAPAHWTLDGLVEAAQTRGITVKRSQLRRILLTEGVRWRTTRSWAKSTDPDFVPKGQRSSRFTLTRQ